MSRKRCLARWVLPQDCVAVRNARERQQERRVAVQVEQERRVVTKNIVWERNRKTPK